MKKHHKPPFKKKQEAPADASGGLVTMFSGLMKGFENVVQKDVKKENKPVESDITGSFLKEYEPLKGLKTLNLQGCKRLGDSQVAFVGKLTSLESINLSDTKVTGECIKDWEALLSLEELLLINCRYLTDEGLVHLGKLKNLKRLVISLSDIDGSCFKEWGGLTSLSELHIRACGRIDEKNLIFLNQLTSLELFDLSSFNL